MEIALRNKSEEIETLIKEKSSIRQMYQTESGRLKEEIESLLLRIKEGDYRIKEVEDKYEAKLKEKNDHIEYLDKLNQDQKENTDKEQSSLKQIIEYQKSELEKEKIANREKEQSLK